MESGDAGFSLVRFVHNALPELRLEDVDTSVEFLGARVGAPFFISCMTGGSAEGFRANKNLALAAQKHGIAVGTGSIRILFEHPEVFEHFHLKKIAPDVPVIANIGGVQLPQLELGRLVEMLRRLEAQAVAVHLNPGQELYQADGDRDFRGILDGVARLCDAARMPVVVKETGFGIAPAQIDMLLRAGAAYVDIAGSGGTNWVLVESYRLEEHGAESAREFAEWGLPTAYALAAASAHRGKLLASGGVRTGLDVAKAIALGGSLAGLALPFIRAEVDGGPEAVERLIVGLKTTVRNAMLLTGSRSVADLAAAPLWFLPGFQETVELLRAGGARVRDGRIVVTDAAAAGPR